MPLSVEHQQMIFNSVVAQRGCPVGVSDRLEAYRAGVEGTILSIAEFVSIDPDKLKAAKDAANSQKNAVVANGTPKSRRKK